MSSVVEKLTKKNLIRPPRFVTPNICYECIMGSVAYGVSSDTSDMDIYGICIPPKEIVFPFSVGGYIYGFDKVQNFEQYQEHHIIDKDAMGGHGREYDLSIYNIVKFFRLAMDNNPNILDSLFIPEECILFITYVGDLILQHRKLFIHKGCYYKLRGYARSMLHKLRSKDPQGKRKEIVEKYGFDTKYLSHLYRLVDECEQLLEFGEMDLRRAKETIKAARRGEISQKDGYKWYEEKERQLEKLYTKSKLRDRPAIKEIKQLLLQCLEHHFGKLDNLIRRGSPNDQLIFEINQILQQYGDVDGV